MPNFPDPTSIPEARVATERMKQAKVIHPPHSGVQIRIQYKNWKSESIWDKKSHGVFTNDSQVHYYSKFVYYILGSSE